MKRASVLEVDDLEFGPFFLEGAGEARRRPELFREPAQAIDLTGPGVLAHPDDGPDDVRLGERPRVRALAVW